MLFTDLAIAALVAGASVQASPCQASSSSTAESFTSPTTQAEANAQGFYYGSENPPVNPGQYLPPTSSYAKGSYKQAIYLSFDGMHNFDLTAYVAKFPNSTWASLMNNAVVYTNAKASSPSDSYPATAALFTGALPRDSGIWWDDTWDRSLYAGWKNCTGPMGAEIDWSTGDDLDSSSLTGGGAFNISYLPHRKTEWGTCETVYPHNFVRTNTVFEVARGNGLVTAYADKHPSYEFLNGPSGTGLSQGFFPEIGSITLNLDNELVWDELHWSAIGNWTAGNWANGTVNPDGGPSLFAANFQSATWAESYYGYKNGTSTPTDMLETTFKKFDERLATFIAQLKAADKLDSTLLLLGSKQGQGPIDPDTLKIVDPADVTNQAGVPVAFITADDGALMWLENGADAVTAKNNLMANATGLGINNILINDEITLAGFGSQLYDPRTPDLIINATVGTLYTTSTTQVANHGGFLAQDLNVPLVAYNPSLNPTIIDEQVSNRQVASTLLEALGLPLAQLDGWRLGNAPVLPGLF